MLRSLVFLSAILSSSFAFAQTQKIDLSKDPSKPIVSPAPSNATLLKETVEPGQNQSAEDLHAKYNNNDVENPKITTTNTLQPANGTVNPVVTMPVIVNTTTQETDLGKGVKAKTYMYKDQEGKAGGSGTSFEFGRDK